MTLEHHIYVNSIRVGPHSTEVEIEALDGTLTCPTGFLQDFRFFLLSQLLTGFPSLGHWRIACKKKHWISAPCYV